MADVSLLFNILARDDTGPGLGSASGKFDKFRGAVDKASVGIVAGLAVAAPAMVNLSRRITELDAKAQTVFGSSLGSVQKWAAANSAALGLTSRETVALATNMADLLKPMGFTSAEAATQSEKMLDLAGALSSWSGGQKTAAEVGDLLTDAMLGETDGLKALGISISAADVEARLLAKGQDKLKGAALQQAAALATQALIMEKSTDAQDRWKNGARAAAEAQNAGKVAALEAKEALAVALTPAIEKGTAMLASFAKWVGENEGKAKFFATTIAGLAGVIVTLSVGMRVVSAVIAAQAIAWRLLATVMWANPVFIIAGIILAIGVALVVAYKKSETFRKVVNAAFQGVKTFVVSAIQVLANTILGFWGAIIGGAAKAFGWIPGVGDKLKAADREFTKFRDSVNAKLNGIKNPKPIHIAVTDDTAEAVRRVRNLKAQVQGGGWSIAIKSSGPPAGVGIKLPARASGGPVARGGTYLVGEEGPEVVTMGASGYVTPNDRLGRLGAGRMFGGGGGTMRVVLDTRGTDRLLLELMRRLVRIEGGGNVQKAFGGA